jgi:hypothetical protein
MPKKIFISHKISEHGKAVDFLKTKLKKYTGQLEIFTSIPAGEDISSLIKEHLKSTDLFILLANYSTPPKNNEWCMYEMGVFDEMISSTDGTKKKIISLVKEGKEPPDPIKNRKYVEETREGIKELLKEIYKDIRNDLFEKKDYEKDMDETITEILEILKPKTVITELAPRVWITIKKDKFDAFKKGEIRLPMDTIITGETEPFLRRKVCFLDDENLTLEKFDEIVDYPIALPHFFTLLEDILKEILNAPRKGPWQIPPLRTMKNTPPRIIVPSALQKDVDGNYIFEFFVTEPPPYTVPETNSRLAALYNLFVISWRFRWIVIERHLNELTRKYDRQSEKIKNDVRRKRQIRKELKVLKLDIEKIYLDSFNRDLEYRMDVTSQFECKNQTEIKYAIENSLDIFNKIKPFFDEALENENISDIIKYLKAWRDINKTLLILTLEKFKGLVEDPRVVEGSIITSKTACEDILEKVFDAGKNAKSNGVYYLSKKADGISKKIAARKTGKIKTSLSKKAGTLSRNAPKKKAKPPSTKLLTATEKVFEVIKRSNDGVNNQTIIKKTGLNQKQVSSALLRLKKYGKIKSVKRGVHTAV